MTIPNPEPAEPKRTTSATMKYVDEPTEYKRKRLELIRSQNCWLEDYLLEVWIRNDRKQTFDVHLADSPEIEKLLVIVQPVKPKQRKAQVNRILFLGGTHLNRILQVEPVVGQTMQLGELLPKPSREESTQEIETRYKVTLIEEGMNLLQTLELKRNQAREELKAASREKPSRKVSTQTTVDVDGVRKHIELRSLVGSLLGGPVDVVARACQSWLLELEDEEKESVKRQVHIYLERFEARWGPELDQYDPALYLQVCMSLGKPQKASLNPILALDDMEAGF